jgi:hypothetical protein
MLEPKEELTKLFLSQNFQEMVEDSLVFSEQKNTNW